MAEITFKQILESDSYGTQKERLQKDINWGDPKKEYFPDRSIFKKTMAEKVKLQNLKKKNIIERRKFYGKDYKKHLNIPEKSIKFLKHESV